MRRRLSRRREWTSAVDQNQASGRLGVVGRHAQRRIPPQRIANQNGGTTDHLSDELMQLSLPQVTAVLPVRFSRSPKSEQINGPHLKVGLQALDIFAPVIGRGSKTVHQQQRRAILFASIPLLTGNHVVNGLISPRPVGMGRRF